MKERGMIFNGEMVRAILDGRKTQTRRIMKAQPSEDFTPMNMTLEPDYKARWYTPGIVDKDGYLQPANKEVFGVANENDGYSCPFGAVGDRIWVRETFQGPLFDFDLMDSYCKDPVRLRIPSFAFTRLMEPLRQSFTMQMMNCIAGGDHQSTCRAGPAAFYWKSPTFALSGCRRLRWVISAKRLVVVSTISAPPLMDSKCGKNCGSPSTALKTGMLTPGFGLSSSNALKAVQYEQSLSR
ncbi:hypothetical protein [Raoultella ornithinolytica]|uniref:hypothetical protein n=1 Tax=Raoultella ornithinolytica TaxID=54291 RepID=UPI00388F6CB6